MTWFLNQQYMREMRMFGQGEPKLRFHIDKILDGSDATHLRYVRH